MVPTRDLSMPVPWRCGCLVCFALFAAVPAALAQPQATVAQPPVAAVKAPAPVRAAGFALWPEGVPNAIGHPTAEVEEDARISNVHEPTLMPYPAPPDRRNGTAVIICPGGAYRRLTIDKEGTLVARRLNEAGISAFVLKYRLKEYGHPAPLRDVLRAVRLVRSQAARWNVDADRIGVMGFSAGGHLAATAGTLFDSPEGRTGADLDRVSARPDFLVLVYPVITMTGPFVHAGSRDNLIGATPAPGLAERVSADLQVTPKTPPTFLVHGGTDQSVPVENSLLFYSALRRNGVAAELHAFQEGPHGFGLEPTPGPVADWMTRCTEWMAMRGLLSARRQEDLPEVYGVGAFLLAGTEVHRLGAGK